MTIEQSPPDLASLARAHQAGVWRYLRFLGCDPALADDLAQETFLAVWRSPFQYRGPEEAAAYLRQTARRLYLQSLKRRAGELPLEETDLAEKAWSAFDQNDSGESYLEALRRCLETLAPRTRQALSMRYGENQSRQAVASALGLGEDGLKSLLQRSKLLLKECVERGVAS